MKKSPSKKIKVKLSDQILWKNYLSVLGVISTIISFLSFGITPKEIGISTQTTLLFFLMGLVFLFIFMWCKANTKKCARLKINNTIVSVTEGDIWDLFKKPPGDVKDELSVIAVNDFFDVIVDDRIIASHSLHGQYINKITEQGKLEELNHKIETDKTLNDTTNFVLEKTRAKGRKNRYKIGSVLEFDSYVLTAFGKFDENNEAWLSAEEYTEFLMRFWSNIDILYAGRTINIPLIGAGITRFKNGKPSKQELLEIMLWSLKISGFHNTYADRGINFIIYPGDTPEIDFYHIQHNPNFN